MFSKLIKWYRTKAIEKKHRLFTEGYNFAAGALLKGVLTKEELENLQVSPFNEFDFGMDVAIEDFGRFRNQVWDDIPEEEIHMLWLQYDIHPDQTRIVEQLLKDKNSYQLRSRALH